MVFENFQYPEADEDILEAINYYKEISNFAASNFERQLSKTYDQLERNPFFQISIDDLYISVKNDKIVLRSKKLNKEVKKFVYVLSVFCTHQNPEKYP